MITLTQCPEALMFLSRNSQNPSRHLLLTGVLSILLSFAVCACGIFPEAMFELAPGSRLPKWFTLPPKLTHADVTVVMYYYSDTVTLKLLGPGKRTIKKISGPLGAPQNLDKSPNYHYPSYQVIVINGTTDIVEHRKMEPIFYVTDDPGVWAALVPKG